MALLPIAVEVDGVPATIYEVSKHEITPELKIYSASVQITYKGMPSKIFTIDAYSEDDLMAKLKIEVTKIKFMELAYGLDFVKRVIA